MDGVTVHDGGAVRVCYRIDDNDEVSLLTTGGAKGELKIVDGATLTTRKCKEKGAICVCAHSPERPLIVTGDAQNFVKCYWRDDLESENVLTRFVLPVRALSFSPSGKLLAAAGDSDQMKIMDVTAKKVLRQLKVCPGVKDLQFDPEGRYLFTMAAIGNVEIWDIDQFQCIAKKPGLARKVEGEGVVRGAWFPNGGSFFCVPGNANEVIFIERETWQPFTAIQLPLTHSKPINAVAFSPNGVYLASGGEDRTLCVFHLPSSKLIVKRKLEAVITDLAWDPVMPSLVIATDSGVVYAVRWDALCTRDSLEDPVEETSMDGIFKDRSGESDSEVDCSEEDSVESMKGCKRARQETEIRAPAFSRPAARELHQVIHPGATDRCEHNKPYFLCWNYAGQIVVQSSPQNSSIQVFLKESKMAPFLDFSGFTMGALSPQGAFFAAPGKEDVQKGWRNAKLHYRAFNSWAQKSTWDVDLMKEEQPVAVATGEQFCAVYTSKNLLRIFTASGLSLYIIATHMHVICLTARDRFLALFYETRDSGIQCKLYDIFKENVVFHGHVPCQRLKWAGFSSQGALCIMDDNLEMTSLTTAFGGEWMPILSGKDHRKQPTDDLFVVEVRDSDVTVVQHERHTFPRVQPPSPLSDFDFHLPVLSDIDQEQEFLKQSLVSDSWGQECRSRDGDEENDGKQKKIDMNFETTLLKMFNSAAKNKEEEKALDIAKRMKHKLHIQGALELSNHNNLLLLSQKVSNLLEQMQLHDR